ncbi:MAG: hypothetical protein VYE22_40920 [Myxococcota bacterium]|nr:hypothetical protein [Myxococcota bacterium]
METRELALVAHFLGLIFWIGGSVVAGTVAAYAARDDNGPGMVAARKAMVFWATPGMLLAWGGGLSVLLPSFGELYARAGWMHAKITVLLVLTALTGVMSGRVRKAAAGIKPAPPKLLDGVAIGLAVGALIVLVLAKLKPF